MNKPPVYTELTVITTLPEWAVRWIDRLTRIVARLSGRKIILSSVKPVPAETPGEPADE